MLFIWLLLLFVSVAVSLQSLSVPCFFFSLLIFPFVRLLMAYQHFSSSFHFTAYFCIVKMFSRFFVLFFPHYNSFKIFDSLIAMTSLKSLDFSALVSHRHYAVLFGGFFAMRIVSHLIGVSCEQPTQKDKIHTHPNCHVKDIGRYNLFYLILLGLVFAPFFMNSDCASAQQHSNHYDFNNNNNKWHSINCSISRFRLAFFLPLAI